MAAARSTKLPKPPEYRRAARRALLDGAVGIGLLSVRDGKYENTPEAAAFLVEGKPSYCGGFPKFTFTDLPHWGRLADVIRSGAPADDIMKTENPFWEELVMSIAPWAFPIAEAAAKKLNLAAAGPISILDVGGGSGAYSAALLKTNAAGHLDSGRLVQRQSGRSRFCRPAWCWRSIPHNRRRFSHDGFRRDTLRPGDLLPYRPRRAASGEYCRLS